MKIMNLIYVNITPIFLFWVKVVSSISLSNKNVYFTEASGDDIADFIASKKYIPNEKELPKTRLIKNIDSDATYVLSKLSDEELLHLLMDYPQRNEFNLNDILKLAFDTKTIRGDRSQSQREQTQAQIGLNNLSGSLENKRFHIINQKTERPSAYFKLNHKPVDQFHGQNEANYVAVQKLKNLVNIYLHSNMKDSHDDPEKKKELLFDILVAQLKSLCCKTTKKPENNKARHSAFVNENLPAITKYNKFINPNRSPLVDMSGNEYMFLILNDEIKSNDSNELMAVDPESLADNSKVLLLGPVTTVLSDDQLKLVMTRISKELMKPEYLALLQQLSQGLYSDNNKNVMKNLVFGPETRRYVKPHRCNHQSKLARVYGGPKWIICTGYLNLNTPSLYD